MKYILLLMLLACSGLFSGCDDPSQPKTTRITVNYEIDRKFQWVPAEKKFTGTILIKTRSIAKDLPLSTNTYGISFELQPGDRTTVIIKSDDEGTYYNGEFPDLPMQLPRLLSMQRSDVYSEVFDYDMRAACDLELSEEPIDGKYYLIFNCYDIQSSWLFGTSFEVPESSPLLDQKYVSLSAGKQEFDRIR
ncbi:MAG: hypothetical protein HPZ91_14350 [Lentisphaeria bacterium]|nr:hypothetical protein [Lentisphaeria bacterium]